MVRKSTVPVSLVSANDRIAVALRHAKQLHDATGLSAARDALAVVIDILEHGDVSDESTSEHDDRAVTRSGGRPEK